ncbi:MULTISPECIES: hypothetical protein [Bradyrhizobium]|nr:MULTISPECIES: hypothetical protein [Bradyrhizobium]
MINELFTMPDPSAMVLLLRRSRSIAIRDYTLKEKARITVGAVAALVIVGWLAVIAVALMSAG